MATAQKTLYAQQMQAFATQLTALNATALSLQKAWFDRTYQAGGAAAMVDADVAALGITAANMLAGVTLCQQLNNFMGNAAVATADNQSTANKLRTDM